MGGASSTLRGVRVQQALLCLLLCPLLCLSLTSVRAATGRAASSPPSPTPPPLPAPFPQSSILLQSETGAPSAPVKHLSDRFQASILRRKICFGSNDTERIIKALRQRTLDVERDGQLTLNL